MKREFHNRRKELSSESLMNERHEWQSICLSSLGDVAKRNSRGENITSTTSSYHKGSPPILITVASGNFHLLSYFCTKKKSLTTFFLFFLCFKYKKVLVYILRSARTFWVMSRCDRNGFVPRDTFSPIFVLNKYFMYGGVGNIICQHQRGFDHVGSVFVCAGAAGFGSRWRCQRRRPLRRRASGLRVSRRQDQGRRRRVLPCGPSGSRHRRLQDAQGPWRGSAMQVTLYTFNSKTPIIRLLGERRRVWVKLIQSSRGKVN